MAEHRIVGMSSSSLPDDAGHTHYIACSCGDTFGGRGSWRAEQAWRDHRG